MQERRDTFFSMLSLAHDHALNEVIRAEERLAYAEWVNNQPERRTEQTRAVVAVAFEQLRMARQTYRKFKDVQQDWTDRDARMRTAYIGQEEVTAWLMNNPRGVSVRPWLRNARDAMVDSMQRVGES